MVRKLIAIARMTILVICGSVATLGFLGMLALVGIFGYATYQAGTSSNTPWVFQVKGHSPPYYFIKEYEGRMYMMKHDPLAEQEGGLRI